MILTIEEYDRQEREALRTMPNRIIEAVRPITFDAVGYPCRVEDEKALARYIDIMHEGRAEATFRELGYVTETEMALLEAVARGVWLAYDFVPVLPGLLRGLVHYRMVTEFCEPGGAILEIGPGCGYLGALLITSEDYEYRSVEVAQAFFLHQNRLWSAIEHEEIAWKQIPWWKFYADDNDWSFNVITANHMLCEMHPHARAYLMKAAKKMLGDDGVFVFEGAGNPVFTTPEQLQRELAGLRWCQPEPKAIDDGYGFDAVCDMLKKILGVDDLTTPDERFLKSIGVAGI